MLLGLSDWFSIKIRLTAGAVLSLFSSLRRHVPVRLGFSTVRAVFALATATTAVTAVCERILKVLGFGFMVDTAD